MESKITKVMAILVVCMVILKILSIGSELGHQVVEVRDDYNEYYETVYNEL